MGAESGGVIGMLEVIDHIIIIMIIIIIIVITTIITTTTISTLSDVMVWLIVLHYIMLILYHSIIGMLEVIESDFARLEVDNTLLYYDI